MTRTEGPSSLGANGPEGRVGRLRHPLAGAAAGAAVLGYAAAYGACPRSPASIRMLRWAGGSGIEDRTASGEGYALTFDDGPHREGTPAVLEILARERVRATFFLVGEQVLRNPTLAAEIVAAGHGVGLHCHRHRNLLRLTPRQVREDILRALGVIEETTGRSPVLYRPPYGVSNAAALALARGRGWRTLLWSHWGRDWEARATPESIAALFDRGRRSRRGSAAARRRRLLGPQLLAAHGRGAAAGARDARGAGPGAGGALTCGRGALAGVP